MIHINFEEPQTDDWRAWRELCKKEQKEHNDRIQAGRPSEVKNSIYKGQKEQVYMKLDGPFRGKCAYCEQKIYGDQPGDIEHFRPKNEIMDAEWNIIKITNNDQEEKHPGYYWLAYDWKNLLPSCESCNRKSGGRSESMVGKGARFPVRGTYARYPGDEIHEDPLLLHPVFDNPEEHLEMDELGILYAKTEKGETCIKIFGLNERGLPGDRKETYEDVRNKMAILAFKLSENPNDVETLKLLQKLNFIKKGYKEFCLAGRKAIDDSKNNLDQIKNL